MNRIVLLHRPDSSDVSIIQDVYKNNIYNLPDDLTGKKVIDIGAQIGTVAVYCAYRGAEVWSFEPASENFSLLKQNVEINKLKNRIHIYQFAVGIPTITKLYIHHKNTGSNSLYLIQPDFDPKYFEEVTVISLKDVFKLAKIDFCDILKLDCEGAERDIIPDIVGGLHERIYTVVGEMHIAESSVATETYDALIKSEIEQMNKVYPKMKKLNESVYQWKR